MIWHIAYLLVLVYIARKAQQMNRINKTPWWYEVTDFVNRVRPGTF